MTTKPTDWLIIAHDELSESRESLLLALKDSDAVVDLTLSPIIGDCAGLMNRVNALISAIKAMDSEP